MTFAGCFMMEREIENCIIVGAGMGLSASLASLFRKENMNVVLAARNVNKLGDLKRELGCHLIQCDASDPTQVQQLFAATDKLIGHPNMVVYNPSARVRGEITSLDPLETKQALDITCYGAFLVAQQAAIRMVKQGSGSIFFTGASAGVKGFPNSSVFAMGKFGLRGLAQSLARELHPKNIHIAHFVIDGGIASKERQNSAEESFLEPDEIANSYLSFHRQKRSAWAWEIELRPWIEKF